MESLNNRIQELQEFKESLESLNKTNQEELILAQRVVSDIQSKINQNLWINHSEAKELEELLIAKRVLEALGE